MKAPYQDKNCICLWTCHDKNCVFFWLIHTLMCSHIQDGHHMKWEAISPFQWGVTHTVVIVSAESMFCHSSIEACQYVVALCGPMNVNKLGLWLAHCLTDHYPLWWILCLCQHFDPMHCLAVAFHTVWTLSQFSEDKNSYHIIVKWEYIYN